jgi:hypothetical protein
VNAWTKERLTIVRKITAISNVGEWHVTEIPPVVCFVDVVLRCGWYLVFFDMCMVVFIFSMVDLNLDGSQLRVSGTIIHKLLVVVYKTYNFVMESCRPKCMVFGWNLQDRIICKIRLFSLPISYWSSFCFVCFNAYSRMSNCFSYLAAVTITDDSVASLDVCWTHMTFSSECSFTCHACCDTGPPFKRSYPKHSRILLLHTALWQRSNHYLS